MGKVLGEDCVSPREISPIGDNLQDNYTQNLYPHFLTSKCLIQHLKESLKIERKVVQVWDNNTRLVRSFLNGGEFFWLRNLEKNGNTEYSRVHSVYERIKGRRFKNQMTHRSPVIPD